MHVEFLLLAGFAAVVSAQTLRACNNFITTSDGDRYQLTSARELGPYFQCKTSDYRLSHYPNTSLPVDSNAACPDPLPNAPDAGQYIVKVASGEPGPGDCATILGASTGTAGNGSAVGIKRCDGRHGFPGQVWTFDGYTISQNNFCWDVKDGVNTNGAKIQVWTCVNGNTNQRFNHVGGDLGNKCVDLTDGSVEDGNQLQIWDCISSNTNQNWLLEVHFP
ncbi:ricin B lectin domain-containing protein [Mycena rebaudengoi]|nr:ricin B lectin domain-containing protein [Mycena rebaudengoi]